MFTYNPYSSVYASQMAAGYSSPGQPPQMMQPQEITKVNGENGAKAFSFRMPPNSSALVLDEVNPLVWDIRTDGAGYPSIIAYTLTPYQSEEPVNTNNLEKRIRKLEEWYESSISIPAGESKQQKK